MQDVQAVAEQEAQLVKSEEQRSHWLVMLLKKEPDTQAAMQTPLTMLNPVKQVRQLETAEPVQVWQVG